MINNSNENKLATIVDIFIDKLKDLLPDRDILIDRQASLLIE